MPIWPGRTARTPTADAALGRQSDLYQPLAGAVVHSARSHDAEDLFDARGSQRALVGERIDTVVRHRRSHQTQVAAGHVDRALTEIQVDGLVGIAGDDVEGSQHVSDRAVAVTGARLGGVDRLVECQFAARVPRVRRADALEAGLGIRAGDQ